MTQEYTPSQLNAMLSSWVRLKSELSTVKEQELNLRVALFNALFKSPKEGTNKLDLTDGYSLKASYPINRSVDEGAYKQYRDEFTQLLIPLDIVKYKAELAVSLYRNLTETQRLMFDRCLISKPGTASLDLVEPKSKEISNLVCG